MVEKQKITVKKPTYVPPYIWSGGIALNASICMPSCFYQINVAT